MTTSWKQIDIQGSGGFSPTDFFLNLVSIFFFLLIVLFCHNLGILLLVKSVQDRRLCCSPLPPEGDVATSLLLGSPAPKPLFSMGPTTGFSCQFSPNRFMAEREREQQRETEKEKGKKECKRCKYMGRERQPGKEKLEDFELPLYKECTE